MSYNVHITANTVWISSHNSHYTKIHHMLVYITSTIFYIEEFIKHNQLNHQCFTQTKEFTIRITTKLKTTCTNQVICVTRSIPCKHKTCTDNIYIHVYI